MGALGPSRREYSALLMPNLAFALHRTRPKFPFMSRVPLRRKGTPVSPRVSGCQSSRRNSSVLQFVQVMIQLPVSSALRLLDLPNVILVMILVGIHVLPVTV